MYLWIPCSTLPPTAFPNFSFSLLRFALPLHSWLYLYNCVPCSTLLNISDIFYSVMIHWFILFYICGASFYILLYICLPSVDLYICILWCTLEYRAVPWSPFSLQPQFELLLLCWTFCWIWNRPTTLRFELLCLTFLQNLSSAHPTEAWLISFFPPNPNHYFVFFLESFFQKKSYFPETS